MTDMWADWLRTRRTGGDSEFEHHMLEHLATVRDRVLDNAQLASGETLLDVGCGNGLIAFGALERGADVVFADISRALLDDCRQLAADAGISDRCRFVEATATELDELEDESIDVVTTRSVLIYVKDKERAFAEFHRVLRPGGRISLFEPINRFGIAERRETWGYDVDGVRDLMAKLSEVYASRQPADDPMLDFDERDLVVTRGGRRLLPDPSGVPRGHRAAGGAKLGVVRAQLRQSEDPDPRRGDGRGAHRRGARSARGGASPGRGGGPRRVADGTRIPVGRQAVAVVVSVAALAGCSFGSDSGDAEFIKEADAICAQHERQISLIPPPQTFLRDFAVFMQRAVPIAREQNEKLRAIEAPEDDAADFRRMVGLMDQQLDLWEQAGRQAFDGNEAQARETFGQSSGAGEEAQRISAEIGFFSCARPEG